MMPPATFGTHPNIVSVSNGVPNNGVPGTGTLLRYDVTTGRPTQIVQFAQTIVSAAQVSADGKWVLFDAETSTLSKVQLVRLDGKYLQTLYCLQGGTQGNRLVAVLWSPDQKHVVFATPANGTVTPIYLLNMRTGNLQLEANLDSGSQNVVFILRTWLDDTHVFVSDLPFFSVPTTLYLLDTSKGGKQKLSDLTTVFHQKAGGTYAYFDFDKSTDRAKLFLTQAAFNPDTGPFAPSRVGTMPSMGGKQHTIYQSNTVVVQNIRVNSCTSLLLRVESSSDTSHNGLWKINTDGTGLTRLTTEAPSNFQGFGEFVQTPWSDVSRDGTRYALQYTDLSQKGAPANSLLFGSVSGGSPTTFVNFNDGTNVNVAGWTVA
jgi:hypothetical protein